MYSSIVQPVVVLIVIFLG